MGIRPSGWDRNPGVGKPRHPLKWPMHRLTGTHLGLQRRDSNLEGVGNIRRSDELCGFSKDWRTSLCGVLLCSQQVGAIFPVLSLPPIFTAKSESDWSGELHWDSAPLNSPSDGGTFSGSSQPCPHCSLSWKALRVRRPQVGGN